MYSECRVLTKTNGFVPAWPSSGGLLFAREGVWSPLAAGRHRHFFGPVLQTEMWFAGWNCLEWQTGSKLYQKIWVDLMSFLRVLTQFFDTVVDKLLLLFLIRDCFCLQVTRLIQNKQVGMTHCIMLINNMSYKITEVVFRSFFRWKTIMGLIKTRPATPLFSETNLGKIPRASLYWHFYARIDL